MATGSYDGGYCYEGELILWNYASNHYQSLLKENREVTACRFVDGAIEFTLNPADDSCEETDEFICETYGVDITAAFPVELSQCRKKASAPYLPSPYDPEQRDALIEAIDVLAKNVNKHYAPSCMAWDMVFIDWNTLAVAMNNGTVDFWDISRSSCRSVRLAPEGMCTQIFYDEAARCLTVTMVKTNYHGSRIYQIDLTDFQAKEAFYGLTALSRTASGKFLCRQSTGRKNMTKIRRLTQNLSLSGKSVSGIMIFSVITFVLMVSQTSLRWSVIQRVNISIRN